MPEVARRRGAVLCAAMLLAWTAAAFPSTETARRDTARRVHINDIDAHLSRMDAMPPVMLNARHRLRLHMRLPEHLPVRLEPRDDGKTAFSLPPGSEVMAVHEQPCGSDDWCIQRVEGVRVGADGLVKEHLLVPRDDDGKSSVAGAEWQWGDELGQSHARAEVARLMVERGTNHPELLQTMRASGPWLALRNARRPGLSLCAMRAALLGHADEEAQSILRRERTFCAWVETWHELTLRD